MDTKKYKKNGLENKNMDTKKYKKKSNLPSQRFVPEMQVSGSLFHSVIERIVFT